MKALRRRHKVHMVIAALEFLSQLVREILPPHMQQVNRVPLLGLVQHIGR